MPAAFTEFLYGDCVPFLKRLTPVTAQQVFDALPNREELEYTLDGEKEYQASEQSRWDTPEFYALATSFLRALRIQQSVKASLERPGFDKDFKLIAATSAADFTEAALHPPSRDPMKTCYAQLKTSA